MEAIHGVDLSETHWQTADIIGMSEYNDPSTLLFELATGSPYGHIAIAITYRDLDEYIGQASRVERQFFSAEWNITRKIIKQYYSNNQAAVFHSTPGGNFTDICCMEPSSISDAQSVIRFIEPLQKEEIHRLIAYIIKIAMNGCRYNFGQHSSENTFSSLPNVLNCSEFVSMSLRAAGRNVGFTQKISTLNNRLLMGILTPILRQFDKRAHPDKVCITPKSIMQSCCYDTVYNPAPPTLALMSKSQHDPCQTESERAVFIRWSQHIIDSNAWEWKILSSLRFLMDSKAFENNCFDKS